MVFCFVETTILLWRPAHRSRFYESPVIPSNILEAGFSIAFSIHCPQCPVRFCDTDAWRFKMWKKNMNGNWTKDSLLYEFNLPFIPNIPFFLISIFSFNLHPIDVVFFSLQKMGSVHGEELPFIFGAPLVDGFGHFPKNYTKNEVALSENIIQYFANFVKTGWVILSNCFK